MTIIRRDLGSVLEKGFPSLSWCMITKRHIASIALCIHFAISSVTRFKSMLRMAKWRDEKKQNKTKCLIISLSLWLCYTFPMPEFLLDKHGILLLFKPVWISIAYRWKNLDWEKWHLLLRFHWLFKPHSYTVFKDRESGIYISSCYHI